MTQVTQAVRPAHTTAHAAIRVECIETAWGLTTLRPQWNGLLRASTADGPFLTWEWMWAWWTHLREHAALHIVTVRHGGQLIAIAPLILIWFGFGPLGKVVIALTVAFFPVLVNTISGLHSASPEILDLARSLHASLLDLFRKVLFPNALPYVFTGLKISMTLSVVGAVIGEFIGGNQGLGYLIQQAQFDINTPLMVAAILLLAVIGISAYGLVALAERLCAPWDVKEASREVLELVDARL